MCHKQKVICNFLSIVSNYKQKEKRKKKKNDLLGVKSEAVKSFTWREKCIVDVFSAKCERGNSWYIHRLDMRPVRQSGRAC
jgi:hypothetical protein